tara:strand:+ start:580 stop:996 length:417 start_codon:yes stop_codon:yes gene_type:complete
LTSTKIDFLKDLGCDQVKRGDGRSLLAHLIGVRDFLKSRGASEYLQDAGLFHSIYGTLSYMPDQGVVSFDDRDIIKNLIGEEAERVVYWFCMIDEPRLQNIQKFEGDEKLKNDLSLLDHANEDDMSLNVDRLDFYKDV